MGESLILRQDHCRVVYRVGDRVHKKKQGGLSYEYVVGQYLNSYNCPSYVRTLAYRAGRLTTQYVPGPSWHQSLSSSNSLADSTEQYLAVLAMLEQLPLTHYDLHMGNVLFPTVTTPCLIDLGYAAIPARYWVPEVTHCEASYSAITCGIFPSVADPDYDRMLFVLALSQYARHFQLLTLMEFCRQALVIAHFDHPLFYGYENFLALETVHQYHFLLHKERQPLLATLPPALDRSTLLQKLDLLRGEALLWLSQQYRCTLEQAYTLSHDHERSEEWRVSHEVEVYSLLYAHKLYRIAHRKVPSFATLRALLSSL
jgi:hypothetical protein